MPKEKDFIEKTFEEMNEMEQLKKEISIRNAGLYLQKKSLKEN